MQLLLSNNNKSLALYIREMLNGMSSYRSGYIYLLEYF